MIVTDNGSTDKTPEIIGESCGRDPRWKFIRLSRNFGYQNSISAGMLAARGEAIMVIDADLQDPPELIAEFVNKWRAGYDMSTASVTNARVNRAGRHPDNVGHAFITWTSDEIKLPLHSGDFRLITRRACARIRQIPETTRYVRGMIHWLGFRQVGIPYVRRGRYRGKPRSILLTRGFMFNAVFNFSVKPLRMFSLFGLGILGLTIVLAAIYLLMSSLSILLRASRAFFCWSWSTWV